ncbi:hypothetical protein GGR52DRAFT_586027 [Hypoxylon sp. FL1284]|nr:hypothetical protein GGR52DRAFT_586027 [Hypoxylon sp. FL1284]
MDDWATASSKTKDDPALRYRKTPIFLLLIYLPTLIVPWVLLCIMTKRPLGSSSYYDPTGAHYISNAAGVFAADLLKSINAVLAVPIISTLLAHAAVVYATRRRRDQKLNVQQLFALADKGWSNYLLLLTANFRGKSSRFLWLGALLVTLGAILQPLISGLVSFETIAATSCLDLPIEGCSLLGPMVVGYDPEPADMPLVSRDLILQDVLGRLVTVSDVEAQPNLWPISPIPNDLASDYLTPSIRRIFMSYRSYSGKLEPDFFVTGLENGTNTGVLREHAVRLNSSVRCEYIQQADIPSPCPGVRPFEVRIERQGLKLSVCVPGNAAQFPFTPSRHRQDIVEDLYLHFEEPHNLTRLNSNTTIRCTASTSRGYFELGNEQNHYVYGPLLDRWPDPDDITANFNDFWGEDAGWARPTEGDTSTAGTSDMLPAERPIASPFNNYDNEEAMLVPGPLMISTEVLFGNYSFLRFLADNTTGMTPAQTYSAVCGHGSIPFSQVLFLISRDGGPQSFCGDVVDRALSRNEVDDHLTRIVASHARTFNGTNDAEYALMMSIYFANRAVLTKTVLAEMPFNMRNIYSSPGLIMVRPTMTMTSLIAISILIFLQTLGLAVIVWLIYSVPTWASAFDAMQVARIGKTLDDSDLPPLGPVKPEDEKRLTKIDALIGRVIESNSAIRENGAGDEGPEKPTDRVRLALGGKGLITRKVAVDHLDEKVEIEKITELPK